MMLFLLLLVGRCDRGFGGPFCVPVVPLPSILKDDFNGNLHPDLWPEVYGAERGNLNGETIKSGTCLIFKGVSGESCSSRPETHC
jgi:reelin